MKFSLFSLIPPPYGVIAHYGLIAALLLGLFGFGYVQGVKHVEHADEVQQAQQIATALKLQQQQDTATRKRTDAYEKELSHLRSVPPQVVTQRVVSYVRSLCDAVPAGGADVSASSGGGPGGSGADPAVRPADGAAAARAELQADIEAAERNAAKLRYCAGWVGDNGGATP